MSEEIWKDVVGWEGYYKVSSLGRVKSVNRIVPRSDGTKYPVKERILKLELCKNGYIRIGLHKDGSWKHFLVHRLVAEAFIPNPENKPQVNHFDSDMSNNAVENLEWCTASENAMHSFAYNNRKKAKPPVKYGSENNMSRKIVKLGINGKYIAKYDTMSEALIELGAKSNHIIDVCVGRRPLSLGYRWMYLEDYEAKYGKIGSH